MEDKNIYVPISLESIEPVIFPDVALLCQGRKKSG